MYWLFFFNLEITCYREHCRKRQVSFQTEGQEKQVWKCNGTEGRWFYNSPWLQQSEKLNCVPSRPGVGLQAGIWLTIMAFCLFICISGPAVSHLRSRFGKISLFPWVIFYKEIRVTFSKSMYLFNFIKKYTYLLISLAALSLSYSMQDFRCGCGI